MAKQRFRIAKEIKDEIIDKLKHNGLSVADAAKQNDPRTVCNYQPTKLVLCTQATSQRLDYKTIN